MGGGRRELVTRDFLGCCKVDDAKDARLPLERLDGLVTSKMPLQKYAWPLQDLNLFPITNSAASIVSNKYQSVCTIDKVKLALEKLQYCHSPSNKQNGKLLSEASPSSSSTITASSIKRRRDDTIEQGDGGDSQGAMIAAACSKCLLYVLISKGDPKCPRCESQVSVPVLKKRPRIDLNVEFLGT